MMRFAIPILGGVVAAVSAALLIALIGYEGRWATMIVGAVGGMAGAAAYVRLNRKA